MYIYVYKYNNFMQYNYIKAKALAIEYNFVNLVFI